MNWYRHPSKKYNAVRTEVNGKFFASKREAARYQELILQEKAGRISGLNLQPVFQFPCGIKYKADFAYFENGKEIVEDVKGFQPTVFRMKAKMFKHHFPGLDFRITK